MGGCSCWPAFQRAVLLLAAFTACNCAFCRLIDQMYHLRLFNTRACVPLFSAAASLHRCNAVLSTWPLACSCPSLLRLYSLHAHYCAALWRLPALCLGGCKQVKKPTESLLGRTPGSTGAAAKKRKRPAAAVLPKPSEAYELDDGAFSSTQQMVDGGGAAKHPRRGGGAGSSKPGARGGGAAGSSRGGRGAAAAMPAVVEDDEESGWEDEDGTAQKQQKQASAGVGTETQAVSEPAPWHCLCMPFVV